MVAVNHPVDGSSPSRGAKQNQGLRLILKSFFIDVGKHAHHYTHQDKYLIPMFQLFLKYGIDKLITPYGGFSS